MAFAAERPPSAARHPCRQLTANPRCVIILVDALRHKRNPFLGEVYDGEEGEETSGGKS